MYHVTLDRIYGIYKILTLLFFITKCVHCTYIEQMHGMAWYGMATQTQSTYCFCIWNVLVNANVV